MHAAGFTPGELEWPSTWTDRDGHDRTPSLPGHELSGVVVELGHGTTGLTVGQRVFGMTPWTRNGSLAEYNAVETRNLGSLPADIDVDQLWRRNRVSRAASKFYGRSGDVTGRVVARIWSSACTFEAFATPYSAPPRSTHMVPTTTSAFRY